jgi:phytanoyl-CoA hydroxylase
MRHMYKTLQALSIAGRRRLRETSAVKLSASELAQFDRDGYLVFPDLLTQSEIDSARAALSALIKENAAAPGTRGQLLVQFEPGAQADSADELRVRKLMWFCDVNAFLGDLAHRHPKIRGIVESLLGANPILFQDMALIKPPFIGSEKPWHQDNAYFAVTPLESVIGVWIALDRATVANGCMHVLAGEHKLGPRRHHHHRDCEIVPDRLEPAHAVPVELPAGGAMYFAGMLPHMTPPNSSPDRRRALQFHYRSATSQIVTKDMYDKVYAEPDGTPASCAAAPPKR